MGAGMGGGALFESLSHGERFSSHREVGREKIIYKIVGMVYIS